MIDKPNPNFSIFWSNMERLSPQSFRRMKTEKGVPTTPVTITPINEDGPADPRLPDNYPQREEHWTDTLERKRAYVMAKLADKGLSAAPPSTFHIEVAYALLIAQEKDRERLEARLSALESSKPAQE